MSYTRDEVREAAEATIKLFNSGKVASGSYELISPQTLFVFDMGTVREITALQADGKQSHEVAPNQVQKLNEAGTKCGTVACIGGWMGAISRPDEATDLYEMMEAEGLSEKEANGLDNLFYGWPGRNVDDGEAWYSENEPYWPYYGNQIPPQIAAIAIQAWLDDDYEENPWEAAEKHVAESI